MDITSSLSIIALAALIHASFQLSVSVLTLLSSRSIGAKHSPARLFRLTTSFVFGSTLMTILLLSFAALIVGAVWNVKIPDYIWSAWCGLAVGVAVSIWFFYYKRGQGTALWIPRPVADYLTNRTKITKLSGEAFGLGLTSVIGEILFIIAPLVVSAFVLVTLPAYWQLTGIAIYTLISMLPLFIVWIMIGAGQNLAKIQKWRENNKYFLQAIAGFGLITLAFFVYVTQITANFEVK